MIKKIISWVILIIIFILAGIYIKRNPEDFLFLEKISALNITLLSLLTISSFYLRGLLTKIYFDYFSLKLAFYEWFGLDCIVSLINYLPIYGGIVSKAIYLKNKHSLSFTKFTYFIGIMNVISILALGVLGIISMGIIYLKYSIFNSILLVIFIMISFFSIAGFLIPNKIKLTSHPNKLINFIQTAMVLRNELKKSNSVLIKLFLINVLILILSGVRLFLIFKITSFDLPFFSCLVVTLLSSLTALIPITPSGLGIREITAGIISKLLGTTFIAGTAVASVDRIITILWTFILGGISIYIFLNNKSFKISGFKTKK